MNNGGRPPIYDNPEDLQTKIDEYKNDCMINEEIPTLTGMILFIGFNSKDTFYEYGKKEGFSDSIKKARLWIESLYEKDLRKTGNTGSIFALKNFGWSDKLEIDNNHSTIDDEGKKVGMDINISFTGDKD